MNESEKYQGYILFESILSFAVVTIIVLELLPLMIFLRQQEERQTVKTESLRYMYELSKSYEETGKIEFGTVTRRGYLLTSSGSYDKCGVLHLQVESNGEYYEIIWQD